MSKNDRDIDSLLRQNAERQLADFDWDGLRRDISRRLTSPDAVSQRSNRYRQWAAVAAAIVAITGVLVLVSLSTMGPGPGVSTPGEARVVIPEATHVIGAAQVSFPLADKPAQCKVEILTSDKPQPRERARASWCIIAAREPASEKPGNGGEVSDILALF